MEESQHIKIMLYQILMNFLIFNTPTDDFYIFWWINIVIYRSHRSKKYQHTHTRYALLEILQFSHFSL
jgi:hypothetical protein